MKYFINVVRCNFAPRDQNFFFCRIDSFELMQCSDDEMMLTMMSSLKIQLIAKAAFA